MSRASLLVVACCLLPSGAAAAEPWFVRHELDAESTYSAAAAVDVNHDGRLDVVCGGWWYAAPGWERHFVREVETIRGRFDDYSALPLDVNGDGRLDLVSCNYRSASLYWVEQPAALSDVWIKHVIDKPGPMETGRLVDVDGDGRWDVLPNGMDFAAWWELDRRSSTPGEVRWLRHDLPQEIAGHGLGCGDLNGDGRNDIVGARGWLEAPEDRRTGRWVFHDELQLDKDASIPILVYDVDRDGDKDVVWGRGHRIGLYWLEQVRREPGQRSWVRHAIDTSWSQAHTLLLADLDGDGVSELIAGKRYLGHEGDDPGEYDPLVIYWYAFDPSSRTWRRGPISAGGRVGFDLDPKAVDLDGDGDIDLVAPGRSGLFWLENQVIGGAKRPAPPAAAAYPDHAQLLVYRDASGELRTVQSPAEMAERRAHILDGMQAAMGDLPHPSRRAPLDVRVGEELQLERYVRQRISFAAEPGDRVPAYLLLPKGNGSKRSAMLCLHQTTAAGKDEPAGLGGRATLHYAHELAERGYVCIVPDYPSFGDYAYDFGKQGADFASGSMKAIWNNIRALDVLESLPQVDHDRIGCIGHSLGGHNGLFTAVFDQRIRAVITSCGFTAFHDYYGGNLNGWTSPRYMPRIRDLYHSDPNQAPFDFYEVLAAIAPRPVFVCAPQHDDNFAVAGVRKVIDESRRVYDVWKAGGKLLAVHPDCGHDFPDDVRRQAYQWLDKQWLER